MKRKARNGTQKQKKRKNGRLNLRDTAPDLDPTCRGASGNVAMVELGTHFASESARLVTLHLQLGAPELYPDHVRICGRLGAKFPGPTRRAPRIHGELLKLGFDVSERTVSRWIQRASKDPDPARRWLVFLRNHRGAIAAMDFFTVPTLTFGVLYCHLGPTARETG